MPIVVRVVPPDEYTKWVGQQKAAASKSAADDARSFPLAELVSRGEKVYAANCVACHPGSGQGMPALKAPALARRIFNTGAEPGPIDTVLNGRPNTAMQAPIASIEAEAKNPVPVWSPARMLVSAIRISRACMYSTQLRRWRSIDADRVGRASGPWSINRT